MRLHLVAGVIACALLPALTWWVRGVGPAWAMFTTSATFRLRIDTVDAHGRVTPYPPALLARRLRPDAFDALVGDEAFRHAPTFTLASHLDDLARALCVDAHDTSIRVRLEVRRSPNDALRTESSEIRCR